MARPLLRPSFGLLVCLALGTAASPGCVMSPRTADALGNVAVATLWTAAIVGQVAVLAAHDAHYHHDHCGHYRRWYGSRWVYYYGGHWEYYDGGAGGWYYYDE